MRESTLILLLSVHVTLYIIVTFTGTCEILCSWVTHFTRILSREWTPGELSLILYIYRSGTPSPSAHPKNSTRTVFGRTPSEVTSFYKPPLSNDVTSLWLAGLAVFISGVYKATLFCQWNLIIRRLKYYNPTTSCKRPDCLVSLAWESYQANSSLQLA
jgi:hypothetical protein